MIRRYKRAGKFIDCDVAPKDSAQTDRTMQGFGFSFVAANPTEKVEMMPWPELARIMGGAESAGPQLMGPQPNGSMGPAGALGGNGERVAIPI